MKHILYSRHMLLHCMWTGCQTVSHCVSGQDLVGHVTVSVLHFNRPLCYHLLVKGHRATDVFFTAAIRQICCSNTLPNTSIHPSVSLAKGSTCYRDLIQLFIKTWLWVPGLKPPQTKKREKKNNIGRNNMLARATSVEIIINY